MFLLPYIIIIFQINILLIKSSTTDFEMERVCSAGNFDKYEQKTGYRTVQHYADDEGMYTTSAHPFYRSLFMTREKSNLNLFIKSIGFELAIVALGGASLINYIIFIILWSVHKCFFRILSKKEIAERLESKCRYCKFFLVFLFLLISLALSIFGIIFIKSFKDSINLSDCGYLRFTNHGQFGDNQNFAGTYNLRDSFMNYTYSIKSIENFYSRMNLFNNDINSINNEFNEKMESSNAFATENNVISPNPDKDLFDFIHINYQEIYGPNTNETTILGIINKYYNERIVPVLEILEEIKGDYRHFLENKANYITEIEKYATYFDVMTQMYEILNDNIGRVYADYTHQGVNTIFYLTIIIYVIFPVNILLLIILLFIYVCKKEVGQCIVKFMRIIIHVLWNILFVLTAAGFVLSGYIGSYRRYSYNLTPSFNYLISSALIRNPNSEENIFQEFSNDSDISRSVNLFGDCYNSSQSTNLANILEIADNLLLYFNKIYQDYNTLLKYIYNNNLDEDITQYILENEALLDTYLYNISKTTSSSTHRENDISKYFILLNQYTDFGNENTYQIDCVTKMYDIWVTNRDDCPEGYIYSLDGSQEKNCLVITDSEWTIDMITIRYLPICKSKNDLEGETSTGNQIKKYLERIKDFYESNNELIIKMKNGVDKLIDLYNDLIDHFNTEINIDNNTFLNFTLPFSKFTYQEDIYNVFDCGILRQDLIDFYHVVRNKLSSISIAHMVILLLLGIFNLLALYFLMPVLYTFYRVETNPEKKRTSHSSKGRTDDKLLTINKSNKRKSSIKDSHKGKTKSKLYVSMGKHTSSETPSSSTENMRSSNNESETIQNEEEESEEKTGNKSSSKQSSSKQSGSKESSSNSKYKSKKKSKSGKESKSGTNEEEDEEEEEEEIESGVRDDGSAMS